MKKRVIALICAALFVFGGLAACGGSSGDGLVGSWNWMGMLYYEFNEDGTGTMLGDPILWSVSGNVLSICTTPDMCGDTCFLPSEWRFQIRGNELTLTSTLMRDLTFTYTRR